MSNNVDHPSHYNQGKFEVIDIIDAILSAQNITPYEGFLLGNVLKYLARFSHKNGVEDIRKSLWYANKLEEVYEARLLGNAFEEVLDDNSGT